jgi:hypothetical protein
LEGKVVNAKAQTQTSLKFKAKKDHVIAFNKEYYKFVKGVDYEKIPTKWEETLKTEGVI